MVVIGNNNQSKNIFRDFCDTFGLEKDAGSRRQIVKLTEKIKLCFSTTFDSDKAECRQTYEDTNGFITYHEPTGKYYICIEENISSNYTYSRTTKNDIKAFSVKKNLDDMVEIKNKKDILEYAKSLE